MKKYVVMALAGMMMVSAQVQAEETLPTAEAATAVQAEAPLDAQTEVDALVRPVVQPSQVADPESEAAQVEADAAEVEAEAAIKVEALQKPAQPEVAQ